MKRLAPWLALAGLILACNTITGGGGQPGQATPEPAGTPAGGATSPPTDAPGQATRTPRPSPTPFQLALTAITQIPDNCSQSPFGLPGEKIVEVAYVPSGFCFNGEIDLFELGERLYVVQSLGPEAAFFITDVTDPQRPFVVGEWQWNEFTYTADVKAFAQGDRRFIVLSLEPAISRICGVAIVEITLPSNPVLVGRYDGKNTGGKGRWCDVHTTQVGFDTNGDGAFIYISAIDTADLRVLDIRDLSNVYEINHYTHPDAGFSDTENFVHDSTIVGERVYLAYWSAGVIILDRAQVEAGQPVEPLNPPASIAPVGLQIHHAYPTADGNFLFVEDEVNYDGQRSQLWLYDIRDLSDPQAALEIALESPFSSPHNLLVAGDLLYVGWYSDGVRVFQYDVTDPENPTVAPYAFKATRPSKSKGVFGSDIFDSIYGVRLHACEVDGQATTCIYASDLTRGLLILALAP